MITDLFENGKAAKGRLIYQPGSDFFRRKLLDFERGRSDFIDHGGIAPQSGHRRNQSFNGRLFEEAADGNLHLKDVSHPSDDLCDQERMASQFEEVISDAHSFNLENSGPD